MSLPVLTVGDLRSILARLPDKVQVYLSSDPEGNVFAPVLEIAYTQTNAIILFPSDPKHDDDGEEVKDLFGGASALLVYSVSEAP